MGSPFVVGRGAASTLGRRAGGAGPAPLTFTLDANKPIYEVPEEMIHHLSIPAQDSLHVAKTLVELFGGALTNFGPYKDSYIAWAGDEHGTAIEVYPIGTEMFPDAGPGQANFRHNPDASGFVATHATVSVNRSTEEIIALASRQGWRAVELSRGSFNVVEFWIENRVMLELMTQEMTKGYLRATRFGV